MADHYVLYYWHEWDSEHYAAGMKQLEDVVG
jgi:proline dehydrogenase